MNTWSRQPVGVFPARKGSSEFPSNAVGGVPPTHSRIVGARSTVSTNSCTTSYVSGELAEWLGDKKMGHVRGAPYHPQTQGKIERWHQTLKNRILLENYYFPADLEAQIEKFVDHYNHRRYHESISNLTPADVYFGRGQAILKQRERIKLKTMETRRLQYRKHAA
jgi:transposase InsO family protein